MTQRDALNCVHEPFGDAFYFGPERLGERYMNDEKRRMASGFSDLTFQAVFDGLDNAITEVRSTFSSCAHAWCYLDFAICVLFLLTTCKIFVMTICPSDLMWHCFSICRRQC